MCEQTIILSLEHRIAKTLPVVTLQNDICTSQHYFEPFGWPQESLMCRRVEIFCKSAKNNNPVKTNVRGVFTSEMLLVTFVHQVDYI